MKIAILTLPLHANYGGILQCYSLQVVLQRMGHDVKVLTKPRRDLGYYVIWPLSIFKRLLTSSLKGERINDMFKTPDEIIKKNINIFIDKYINRYVCRTWNSDIAKKFDVIIVGSDQIWRPEYSKPIEFAFLSFLKDVKIKRISYAASFGVDFCEYTQKQIKKCSLLLRKFDAVSVREFSGVNICKKYFGVNAVQMLDPTLLLTADDYHRLVDRSKVNPIPGNMLVYILDKTEDKILFIERIAREKGLIPFWLDSPDERNVDLALEDRTKLSVEQWIYSFENATFVCTDSFHGCIFSIIFQKQFVVVGNKDRGLARVKSLFDLFSLNNDLLVLNTDKWKCTGYVDFCKVNEILEEKREEAFQFINRALSNN